MTERPSSEDFERYIDGVCDRLLYLYERELEERLYRDITESCG